MTFTSPIWLLGLLPWAAAAVLLLMSRRPASGVPFLDLWRLNAPREAIRRRFSIPPAGVVLALLAALAAIVAAAGPATHAPGAGGLTIVIDAGASMSARGEADLRFRESAAALAVRLRDAGRANMPVEVVIVPDSAGRAGGAAASGRRVPASDLPAEVAGVHASALNTAAALDRVVRLALADPAARLVVLSDQPLAVADDRLAQATPAGEGYNVGIRRLSVRRSPVPQAMVRIARTGPAPQPGPGPPSVLVRLTSAGRSVEQRVDVPQPGSSRDLFVTLPAAGAVVTAELVGPADAFPGDDRAYVAAEVDWPAIEPAVPVGPLQRLVDLYAASRPAGERSVRVRLVPPAPPPGASDSVIILQAAGGPTAPARPVRATDHPITAAVGDWASLSVPAATDRRLPDGRWDTILSDAAGPLVTVRESSADGGVTAAVRQVWCALDTGGWANRAEFVSFWSAAFDWAGRADAAAGAGDLTSDPLEALSPEWRPVELAPGPEPARYWPGLYERQGDGRRRAFGPAEPAAGGLTLAPAEQLARLDRLLRAGDRRVPWSPWLLAAAAALTVAAAAVWKREGATVRFARGSTARSGRPGPPRGITLDPDPRPEHRVSS